MRSARFRPRTFVLWLLSLVFIGSLLSFTGVFVSNTATTSDLSSIADRSIEINYPQTIKVGETFQLSVDRTEGFTARSGSRSWFVLGSSKGLVHFKGGNTMCHEIEPSMSAVREGQVDILLTVVDEGVDTRNPESIVNQIVSIQVLR